MSIVDRLQSIVKERGTTFKQLERDCGIGNGTIRRWEEQSPRLDKLSKVANFLQVSLDYLVFGSGEIATSCDGVELSQVETDMIAMFRLLPEASRKEVFDLVHFKYMRLEGGEKESIYSTYFDESEDEESGSTESRKAQGGTA